MFERILIPLDGSPLAEATLAKIDPILRRQDSEILLLRVAQPPMVVYGTEMAPPVVADHRGEAKSYLARIEGELTDKGARVRSLVEDGPPAGSILDTAEREKVTLIAMATHGRTGLARWVFGSVTEKVVRASPIPLLVLRSFPASDAEKTRPFERILVPIEHFFLRIGPYVKDFARLFDSKVTLLHVVETGEDTPSRDRARAELEIMAKDFRQAGVPTETREREGDAAQEILECSHQERASLIAITTHGRRGPTRWALGSVTEKVLRSATAPLLIVRNL